MSEALALQLYRRFVDGESVDAIAKDLGVPADRIHLRLRAAAVYLRQRVYRESELATEGPEMVCRS